MQFAKTDSIQYVRSEVAEPPRRSPFTSTLPPADDEEELCGEDGVGVAADDKSVCVYVYKSTEGSN